MFKMSLTKRYIPAIMLLIFFIVFSHMLIYNVVNSNTELAKIINISGKQRMLSQRLIILGQDYYENPLKIDLLKISLNEIKNNHKYLLTKIITPKINAIYFDEELDENLHKYLKHFENLLVLSSPIFLKSAREESKSILLQLDNIVKEYERYSNEKLKTTSQYEFYLMLLTLLILVLEVIFIFRPAALEIEKNTRDLIEIKDYEETVIESNNNAIIALDAKGLITTFNQKAVEIFGWEKSEMIGTTNIIRIIPIEYRAVHDKASKKYFKTGKSCGILGKTRELEAIKKDGTVFPIRISFGSKFKENSTVVVANISDITEERKQSNIIMQQSKLASVGEMIGNIAHQWRQPLSAISTSASGLQVEQECGIMTKENLNNRLEGIIEKTNYLSQTIDDFRDFFKQSKKKELFKIHDVLHKVENITSATYKKEGLTIDKNYDTNTNIFCLGYSNQLSQVIINILNNAKDIILEKKCPIKVVKIDLDCSKSDVLIKIYDSAGGIPSELFSKIFEPYFTTKEDNKGTGIGLYMSNEIITNRFNGKLSASNQKFKVDSKEYYGACFEIVIPMDIDKSVVL